MNAREKQKKGRKGEGEKGRKGEWEKRRLAGDRRSPRSAACGAMGRRDARERGGRF